MVSGQRRQGKTSEFHLITSIMKYGLKYLFIPKLQRYHGSWRLCNNLSLQLRHNEHDGVSNHRRLDCLLNRLFKHRSKITSKLRVTGLSAGISPVTGEIPAFIKGQWRGKCFNWWRHHVLHLRRSPSSSGVCPSLSTASDPWVGFFRILNKIMLNNDTYTWFLHLYIILKFLMLISFAEHWLLL